MKCRSTFYNPSTNELQPHWLDITPLEKMSLFHLCNLTRRNGGTPTAALSKSCHKQQQMELGVRGVQLQGKAAHSLLRNTEVHSVVGIQLKDHYLK